MKKIIKYRNLKINNKFAKSLNKKFKKFLKSGQYLPGLKLREFEDKIAEYCDRKYCIAVSSGTTALYLALKSINLPKGSEVICPAISWIATAHAIVMAGYKPVFVDVNFDQTISLNSFKRSINKNTKALMIVHFKGILGDIFSIMKEARKNNIIVIEDAAQAFGAKKENKIAGSFGDLATFSFNPMKVFGGFGEGGAILTDSKKENIKLRKMRDLGLNQIDREKTDLFELNYKFDELHATLLIEQLKFFKKDMNIRKNLISEYKKRLRNLVLNSDYDIHNSSGYDYQILVKKRNSLRKYLIKNNIETRIKHPILIPHQNIYKKFRRLPLKNAEKIVKQSISLPLHSYLNKTSIEFISNNIKTFYTNFKK